MAYPANGFSVARITLNGSELEAPDGALREADIRGTGPEYPKVKVLARWN